MPTLSFPEQAEVLRAGEIMALATGPAGYILRMDGGPTILTKRPKEPLARAGVPLRAAAYERRAGAATRAVRPEASAPRQGPAASSAEDSRRAGEGLGQAGSGAIDPEACRQNVTASQTDTRVDVVTGKLRRVAGRTTVQEVGAFDGPCVDTRTKNHGG